MDFDKIILDTTKKIKTELEKSNLELNDEFISSVIASSVNLIKSGAEHVSQLRKSEVEVKEEATVPVKKESVPSKQQDGTEEPAKTAKPLAETSSSTYYSYSSYSFSPTFSSSSSTSTSTTSSPPAKLVQENKEEDKEQSYSYSYSYSCSYYSYSESEEEQAAPAPKDPAPEKSACREPEPAQELSKSKDNLALSTAPNNEMEISCPPPNKTTDTRPSAQDQRPNSNREPQQKSEAQRPSTRFGPRNTPADTRGRYYGAQDSGPTGGRFTPMREKHGEAYKNEKQARKTGDFNYGKINETKRKSIFDDE